MKKYNFFIGIDVSKSWLDVYVLNVAGPKKNHFFQVANSKKGIKALVKKFPKQDFLVCFEHTGNYGLTLCYQLEKFGIDFWVENPLLINRFKGFKRGKNDKADAKDIAEYAFAQKHKVKLYKLKEDDLLKIRVLLNHRALIIKSRQMLKGNKESFSNYPKEIKKAVEKLNTKQIKALNKQLKDIQKEIDLILKANQDLNTKANLAKSLVGIGDQVALQLLVKTSGFMAFSNWRKFSCYIGSAPFEYSSGSSIKGKTRVSHFADKKMKALLTTAAVVAKQHDPEIKQYYDKKIKEGKNEWLVKNNVRNKLLARVFASLLKLAMKNL